MRMADNLDFLSNEYGVQRPPPLWATEDTLKKVAKATEMTTDSLENLITHLTKGTLTTQRALTAVNNAANATVNAQSQFNQDVLSQSAAVNRVMDKTTTTVESVIGSLKNVDKPIEGAFELTSKVTGLAGEGIMALMAAGQSIDALKKLGTFAAKYAKLGALLAAVVGAWFGFQVTRAAQLVDIQKNLADMGAVFSKTGKAMSTNIFDSIDKLGLSVTDYNEIVQQGRLGIRALGGSMSEGIIKFTKLSKTLDGVSRETNYYGMGLAELHAANAEYLEARRLSVGTDMKMTATQDKLVREFDNLVIESTALANVTAMSRSDYMKSVAAEYSEVKWAASLGALEKIGNEDYVKVVNNLIKDAPIAKIFGEAGEELIVAVQEHIYPLAQSGDLSKFSLDQALSGSDLGIALRHMAGSAVDEFNEAVRSGDPTKTRGAFTKLLSSLEGSDKELSGYSAQTQAQIQQLIRQLQAQSQAFGKDTKTYREMMEGTEEEQARALKEMAEKTKTSAELVGSTNDIQKTLIQAQRAFTLDLEELTGYVGTFTRGIIGFADSVGLYDLKETGLTIDQLRDKANRRDETGTLMPFSEIRDSRTALDMLGDAHKADLYFKDGTVYNTLTGDKVDLFGMADMGSGKFRRLREWVDDNIHNGAELKKQMHEHYKNSYPREKGGPISANSTYLVGEKGPEMIVPRTSGEVISNENLTKMLNNNQSNDMKQVLNQLDETIKIKEATLKTLDEMKNVVKNIKRNNALNRATR